ncbi:MAG TPA: hypothetical protein ENI15_17240 [Spirochaetes bacterium]|nr:hypothetical protein [Spirochaetota bacterium]
MPDNENIDSLIEMLEDVGERELALGMLSQKEIDSYQQKTAELSSRVVKEEAPVEAVEEASLEAVEEAPGEAVEEASLEAVEEASLEAVEEAPVEAVEEASLEAVEEAGVVEGDLTDLLNDIEIGLTEEKELEEQFRKKKEAEREAAPLPAAAEEEAPVEFEEELTGEPAGAGAGEAPVEEGLGEEALEGLFEEAAAVGPEEEAPAGLEGEVTAEEPPAEPLEAMAGDEGFDLPADFDMGGLDIEEGPPEGLFKEEKPPEEFAEEGKDIGAAELPPEETVSEEILVEEEPMEIPPAEPGGGETEEPSFDDFDMPDLDEIGSIEETPAPSIAEVSEAPDSVIPEVLEEETPAGTIQDKDEFELPEFEETAGEAAGLVEEAESVEELVEEGEEIAQVGEDIEDLAEAVPAGEIDIELSEEDIILITTKLKQIDPAAGSRIRDLIVKVDLPVESLKELLELLILDVPEEDILRFIERTTGEKIVTRRVPEVMPARKPGRLADLMASLGPLVRITGLSVAIVGVIGLLFGLFLYRPLRSAKYYKEGLEYIKQANYPEAEVNFKKATRIYSKIKEYDNFGYEYMLSGNYDAAIVKFTEGIDVDETSRNLNIRMHLAMLYNVLSRYGEADQLYDEILGKNTGKYEIIRAKGRNLIDWGKEDSSQFETAYSLFKDIYSKDRKNSDALTQMLYVNILQKDSTNIDLLYDLLKNKYSGHIDKEVYTKLAEHYISNDRTGLVWNILSGVLNKSYDYPQAHFAFSKYFKKLDNKDEEENFLIKSIQYERDRELVYPWDTRNRVLLSNAYNNLGELYARMELPGKAAESINYFKQAIEENDNNEVAYFNLAQAYFYEEKNFGLAKKYYETAQSKGYEDNDLRYNLGFLYYYEKSYYGALNQWMILSELMPNNPNVKFAMGSAFLHLGKYNPAIGELLMLSEFYSDLIEDLGEIKPWRAYHKKILLGAVSVYSNLGVAYQSMYEDTNNTEHQKNSLINLYKAGEFADIIGIDWGSIQYNINYIIHPRVIHGDMAINERISDNYKFVIQ